MKATTHPYTAGQLDFEASVKDSTQIQVDGIIHFQPADPVRASYGSKDTMIVPGNMSEVVGLIGPATALIKGVQPQK
jgi:hypothetical protein